jgi:membrane protease YdiL (CAAX protease family)
MSRGKSLTVAAAAVLVDLAAMLFLAAPAQARFGLWGLALTELLLLVLALAFAFALRRPLREIFPMKRPEYGQISGSILLFLGAYFGTAAVSSALLAIHPAFLDIPAEINNFVTDGGRALAFLTVALLPAVCEEALYRGTIQTALAPIRRDWARALAVGLLFGLTHLDPLRSLPLAVLGVGLAYILMKTGNILLPMALHLVNNLISLIAAFGQSGRSAATLALAEEMNFAPIFAGMAVISAGIAVLFAFPGWRRLNELDPGDVKPWKRRTATLIGVALILTGFVAMIVAMIPMVQAQMELILNE